MSSAAKLRKYGRGTATVAAAALVMTSFGPAALAWDPPTGDANTAGVGSVGLTDVDRQATGTQGALAVSPGATGQDLGEVKFVLPNTFDAGDTLDFTLDNSGGTGTTPADRIAERIQFSSTPAVQLSGPWGATTHVAPASPGAANTGATEAYDLQPYGTSAANRPPTPTFTATVRNSADGVNDVLRLTMTSNPDPAYDDAKFIGTINAQVDVGANRATGNVTLTADARNDGSTAPLAGFFKSDPDPTGPDTEANVTIPGYVIGARLDVRNGNVVADGTAQFVGPFTVTSGRTPFTTNAPVTVDVSSLGTDFTTTTDGVTATQYSSTGSVLSTSRIASGPAGLTVPAVAGAARVEFSGALITAPTGGSTITYTLAAAGGVTPPPPTLTAAEVNQRDITAPGRALNVNAVATTVPERIGGSNRYQTAVNIAQRAVANGASVVRGESDNVVIASGESFPDALSSGYLAATKDAQLLLTQNGQLPQSVIDFLRTYGAKNVYIVGGARAVGERVENQLRQLTSYDVQVREGYTGPGNEQTVEGADRVVEPLQAKLSVYRIAGANRFDTNQRVNEYAGATSLNPVGTTQPYYGSPNRRTAILADGITPWDALAAGPLVNIGTNNPIPLVLTTGSSLPSDAREQMNTLDIGHAIVVGGQGVIPASIERELTTVGTSTRRISGANRFATAAAIADFVTDGPGTAAEPASGLDLGANNALNAPYLVNGGYPADKWADALAAGPSAAAQGHLIAPTMPRMLPAETRDMLNNNAAVFRTNSVIALGLGSVVSTEVVNAANAALAD